MTGDLEGAALLFDLDGTLVDTAWDLGAAMNHALAAAGHAPVPLSEVRHLIGHGARRMLARGFEVSAGKPANEAELDRALTQFLGYYHDYIAVHSRPFDGVIEMIGNFRARGAKMAVCTNKREALAARLIDTLGLSPLFEAVVGSDSAAAAKPDPAPVRMCLERTGALRAAFIGDSDTDILAAKSMALPCFIADFGYGPVTLAREASGLFSSYPAAAGMIEKAIRA